MYLSLFINRFGLALPSSQVMLVKFASITNEILPCVIVNQLLKIDNLITLTLYFKYLILNLK
jgi:hypothetical protein